MAPSSEAVDDRAREFATRFTDESFADAADVLSEAGREAVVESFPEDFERFPVEDAATALRRYWYGLRTQHGEFQAVGDVTVSDAVATVDLAFAAGEQPLELDVEDGELVGVAFPVEYEPPAYADSSAFTEREVSVENGDVELGGTLTVPDGESGVPGVVLVHGAGLHDRDGTAGESKILRDFAWGLASQGIAVLRYEKRLHEHDVPDEEYDHDTIVVDDAVEAVDVLAAAAEVDPDSVFLAGHSQGGACAPRIAERHGGVAGIVSLDGPTDPGIDLDAIEFMRYGVSPDGDLTEEQEELLEQQQAELKQVVEGDYDEDGEVLGQPAAWHESMLSFDPVGTAADLSVPLFAATTERVDPDVHADLREVHREAPEEWREATSTDLARVEHYEDVGHYFQHGETPAVTMEYLLFGGNVAD
jgi:pimeloyl-ACP methyl ester carboxylesterase